MTPYPYRVRCERTQHDAAGRPIAYEYKSFVVGTAEEAQQVAQAYHAQHWQVERFARSELPAVPQGNKHVVAVGEVKRLPQQARH
jgi:hypothetical protein